MEKNKYLNNIGGYEYQKNEAEKIVRFFKNYNEFTNSGASLPRGVFFYGEPGNGKTLFANSIAKQSGVKTFYLTDNLYMKDDASISKELVMLFKEATEQAPSIIILDEIDQLVDCGTSFAPPSDCEKEVLRVLLTEIDKLEGKGVLIMATANVDIHDVPSALVRNGRIEKHIYIGNPDLTDREDILKMFLKNKKCFRNLRAKEVAKLTSGLTCASLKTLVNDVLIKCVTENQREATYQDFHDPLQVIISHGIKTKSLANIEHVVYHEVGHLVADFILNGKIGFVSVESYGGSEGRYKRMYFEKGPLAGNEEENPKTLKEFNNKNIVSIAGLAATEVFMGEKYSGSSSDLNNIKHSFENMCLNGLLTFEDYVETVKGFQNASPLTKPTPNINTSRFAIYLNEIYEKALDICKTHSELVEVIAAKLKINKTLSSQEVEEIIKNM